MTNIRQMLGIVVLLLAGGVAAQSASEPVELAIAPQPLGSALAELAEQTGLQIIFPQELVAGQASDGLRGSHTPRQALELLLRGSGLAHEVQGETIILRRAPPQEPAPASTSGRGAAANPMMTEVLVTAQRREQNLQEVPISVSVLGGQALQREGVRTLEDVAAMMPTVNISQVPGSDSINIRGIGSGNDLGFEQSVATFVDGVYRSRSRASRVAFFDVERVEVLRGPQTTFFGNNAIAGALNITTRKPSDQFEASLMALYSPSDGEYNLEGAVSVPLSDEFAVRVAARSSGMDGYIRNHLDDYGPELDNEIGRVSFAWQPNDVLQLNGRVDVARIRDQSTYNSELLDCPAPPIFGAPAGACARHLLATGGAVDDELDHHTVSGPSYFEMDLLEASLNATVDLEASRVVAITGFYDHDYEALSSVIPTLNASVVDARYGLPTQQAEEFRQFSQELRVESTWDRGVDWMAGVYYATSRGTMYSRHGYFFAPFGMFAPGFQPQDPIAIFVTNKPEDEVVSVFGATTFHFSPNLRLNLGLRYSEVEKESSRLAQIGVSEETLDPALFVPGSEAGQAVLRQILGVPAGDFARPRRRDDELMPAVGLEYNLSDATMLYATYTHGFKAGGFAVGLLDNSFDPETVDAFEAGLKTSLLGDRLRLNIAAFYSEYSDLQASSFIILPSGAPVGIIGNVAESISEGVELSGVFSAAPGLLFNFDVSYLNARYDNYPVGPCTQSGTLQGPNCVQDLSDKRRAFSPEFSGNLGVSHVSPLFGDLELRLDASLLFTSDYFLQANAEPNSRQAGFAKLNARAAVGSADGRWEVALIGRNLTDRTTASYWSPLPSSPGSGQALADRPRSVALQLLYQFD